MEVSIKGAFKKIVYGTCCLQFGFVGLSSNLVPGSFHILDPSF